MIPKFMGDEKHKREATIVQILKMEKNNRVTLSQFFLLSDLLNKTLRFFLLLSLKHGGIIAEK